MGANRDSPSIEDVEAVVDQLGNGDLALVDPHVLLTFEKALRVRLGACDDPTLHTANSEAARQTVAITGPIRQGWT